MTNKFLCAIVYIAHKIKNESWYNMFFKNIINLDDLKSQYKKLARIHHPDCGGDTQNMQILNNEFDALFILYKKGEETSQKFASEFYTSNGWKGSRYNHNLDNKDIVKLIKNFVKIAYSNCKFSATLKDYRKINISLTECYVNPFIEDYDKVEDFYINMKGWDKDKIVKKEICEMFNNIANYILSYNYDDSNGQIDYFNTNFYFSLYIGKWDKKVVIKDRKVKTSNSKDLEK